LVRVRGTHAGAVGRGRRQQQEERGDKGTRDRAFKRLREQSGWRGTDWLYFQVKMAA
jgi:hypothetical protein